MFRSLLIQWITPIAALVATAITVYKFYVQRPSLILDVEAVGNSASDDGIVVELAVYVANVGRDFAEDGYVEFELDGWAFDEPPAPAGDGDVVGVSGDSNPSAAIGDAERYKLFLDSIIYQKTGFQLYTATATLVDGETYDIEYVTACQSQKPKAGRLTIRVDAPEVAVSATRS